MRPQKILDQDLITALTTVFRSKGYEGASLNELAEVTGLKKASLYHRFPNGKQEMAEAVISHMDLWVQNNVFRALTINDRQPSIRLTDALAQIRTLYDGGKETCIFRAFSMQQGLSLFQENIREGINDWIEAFTKLGKDLSLSPAKARELAVQSLIDIQGSLILTKALDDSSIFEKALINIEKRYLKT
ncbi:TetR/AcrR family transcriptional regulator [Dyadobacter tibetensis]|uniref:TetR/AcrR family transcriptional regulator n=1 Tax=Dyadobacter tibetensis TaxID=1211851 RepID=UPI00046EEFE2|nr:TetR/AcrR family transcriptional regulator [Dyadobacter tibetensis]